MITADGWYRSGDLAVIDAAGYVRITGRVKDVINRGGEKVPVAEIEQLLLHAPVASERGDRGHAGPAARRAGLRVRGRRSGAASTSPGCGTFLDAQHVAKHYWPERLELARRTAPQPRRARSRSSCCATGPRD